MQNCVAGESLQKRVVFQSALPRAGGTLMHQILAQRADVFATAHSPLLELVHAITALYDGAFPKELRSSSLHDDSYRATIRSLVHGFYSFSNCPVIIDRSGSGALHYCELLDSLMPDFKVVVCVRDLRDIISALEIEFREDVARGKEVGGALRNASALDRAQWWLREGPLALGLARLARAVTIMPKSKIFLLRYEDLCSAPHPTLSLLRDFLGLEPAAYDLQNLLPIGSEQSFAPHAEPGARELRPPRCRHLEILGPEAARHIVLSNLPFYRALYPEVFSMDPKLLLAKIPQENQ